MRSIGTLTCLVLICSAYSLASERTDFASLPPDAQASISAAISIQDFTLSPSDGQNGAEFGIAVAIDGDTVVVGTEEFGAAYVFVKPAGGWANMTQTAELTFSEKESAFGYSVAISGNTIVVGCGANTTPGAACVFVKPPTGWANMTETAELTASDGLMGSGLGDSVAISGNTVLAGLHSPTILTMVGRGQPIYL